jgi:hypothetical protein
MISIPLLNFTSVTEKGIIKHQTAAFNKVDARNYYEWIKMIVKKPVSITDSGNNIHTNFKAILNDKVPRGINFYYMKDITKTSLEKIKEKNFQVFLKPADLNSETANFIKSKIESNEYKFLFNDGDFILFVINPV